MPKKKNPHFNIYQETLVIKIEKQSQLIVRNKQ